MKDYFYYLSMAVLLSSLTAEVLAQQSITGTLTDEVGNPIIEGTVKAFRDDIYVASTSTDLDGNYQISLDKGANNIELSYTGYTTQRISGLALNENQLKSVDARLKLAPETCCYEIIRCPPPMLRVNETTQGMILHAREIRRFSKPN